MKIPLSILLLLFLVDAVSFGQSSEKQSSAKNLVSGFQQIASQMPDTVRGSRYTVAASLPAAKPAFALADSSALSVQDLSRKLFTRSPFFINEEFAVSLSRHSQNDFKYANVTSVGTSFQIRPTDKLSISVTPVISHYFFGSKQYAPFTDISCNVSAQYAVSDWLAVRSFGQVSTTNGNKINGAPYFSQPSFYGAGVMFKVSDNVKFEVSVDNARYAGFGNYAHSWPAGN